MRIELTEEFLARIDYLERAVVDLLYLARCQGWKFDYQETPQIKNIRLSNEISSEGK
ncbi:MAG TPA: hypothetical protein VK553_10485 [Candidatus Nitrosopolaris rasttigaisensis]|nr:hypothetical protein [Candidatus Nitrosopolaris rasttigaisensis]